MPAAALNRHRRALLAPHGDRSQYVERALAARRLRELRRVARRLGDLGAMLFTTATEPSAVAFGIEDFLVLEANGWKGKAGTAAACRDDISRFIRTGLVGLAAEGKVAIKRILVDGRAIAATITLRSADAAWFWKTAYDERFARFAPGVLLAAALTEDLVEDVAIAQTDSCATAGHPVMEHIWRERLALCDLMVAVRPQAPFSRAQRLEMLRSALIAAAKSVREKLHW
jgi:CelD/BcsL family acetyltransferase involved in cellulose biosynthesis